MTQSNELDLAAWKATAEAANYNGLRWEATNSGDVIHIHPVTKETYVVSHGIWDDEDREHIATFDPPTVLRLIAALEAAQADLDFTKRVLNTTQMVLDDHGQQLASAVSERDAAQAVADLWLAHTKAAKEERDLSNRLRADAQAALAAARIEGAKAMKQMAANQAEGWWIAPIDPMSIDVPSMTATVNGAPIAATIRALDPANINAQVAKGGERETE